MALTDKPYNKTLGVIRLGLTYLVVVALVTLARPTPSSVTLGFCIAAMGEAVRIWAAGHLLKTAELVTSGPYLYTRNPLYLGRLLIYAGLCTMATLPYGANWIVLALGLAVFFGYYLRRKERVEPARLSQVHGEAYDRYLRAVPALFPSLHPYSQGATTGWSSDRMLRNREHWMVLAILAVSLVLLWRANHLEQEIGAPTEMGSASGQTPGR